MFVLSVVYESQLFAESIVIHSSGGVPIHAADTFVRGRTKKDAFKLHPRVRQFT